MKKALQPEEEWNEEENLQPMLMKWSRVVMSSGHPMGGVWRQTGKFHHFVRVVG